MSSKWKLERGAKKRRIKRMGDGEKTEELGELRKEVKQYRVAV